MLSVGVSVAARAGVRVLISVVGVSLGSGEAVGDFAPMSVGVNVNVGVGRVGVTVEEGLGLSVGVRVPVGARRLSSKSDRAPRSGAANVQAAWALQIRRCKPR
jgi:hypothetical protein